MLSVSYITRKRGDNEVKGLCWHSLTQKELGLSPATAFMWSAFFEFAVSHHYNTEGARFPLTPKGI